jgi:carbamate kinase
MEPVLSWVKVDPYDPGFSNPSKPVGQQLSGDEVAALLRYHPEYLFTDYDKGKRRLIASPQPKEVLNVTDILDVIEDGKVPVALGGGGIPVFLDYQGRREITDCILDKDLSSSLLSIRVAADVLLILTNEQGMYTNYRTPSQRLQKQINASQVETWLAAGEFPPGSMGPKAEAAIQFLAANPSGRVIIGHVEERAEKLLAGSAGSTITAG